MGHIKEPDGVDFIIKGKPLTEKEKKANENGFGFHCKQWNSSKRMKTKITRFFKEADEDSKTAYRHLVEPHLRKT